MSRTLLFASLFASAAGAEELRLVSDRIVQGTLTDLAADGRVVFRAGDKDESFAGEDIFTLEVSANRTPAPADAPLVRLADGSARFWATGPVKMSDGKVSATSAVFGKLEFGINAAAAVRFAPKPSPDFEKRLDEVIAERRTRDTLLAVGKDKLIELDGELKNITETTAVFRYDGEDRSVNLSRVYAVGLAVLRTPASTGKGPEVSAELTEGSRIVGKLVKVTPEAFTLAPAGLPELTLPRKSVTRLNFSSGRIVELSSLMPNEVKERPDPAADLQQPMPTLFPFQKDRAILHPGRIKLDGTDYPTGLCLHSYCKLSFDLGGKFETFTARAGIDDSVRRREYANVGFHILLDDKEVLTRKVVGTEQSFPVRLDVTGAKKLTIIVDFGDDQLDVCDHLSLGGARLLKRKE